jgi:uncharacterized protein
VSVSKCFHFYDFCRFTLFTALGGGLIAGNLFAGLKDSALKEIFSQASRGDPTYQLILGQMYAEGADVPQNYNEAIKWTHRAANRNNRNAQYYLGNLYLEKAGLIKHCEFTTWYRETPVQLQTFANLNQSSSKEISEASRWFERAAVGGHAGAQCCIGRFYALGIGVRRNDLNAMNYYRRASRQGHREAQFLLAEMLTIGFLRNYTEAFQLFKASAEQGDSEASYYFALLHERGLGTVADLPIAKLWYQRASSGGSMRASLWLAWSYFYGRGVKKDLVKSAQLFLQVAQSGTSEAQKQIALMYFQGMGIKKNLPESYRWFHLAACQGQADCAKARDSVGKLMKPHEHEAARRLIESYFSKK